MFPLVFGQKGKFYIIVSFVNSFVTGAPLEPHFRGFYSSILFPLPKKTKRVTSHTAGDR